MAWTDIIRVVVVIAATGVIIWFAVKQGRSKSGRDRFYSPRYRYYTPLTDELAYMNRALETYLALISSGNSSEVSDDIVAGLRQIAADADVDLGRMHYDLAMFFAPEVVMLTAECKALFQAATHPPDYRWPYRLDDDRSLASKVECFFECKARLDSLLTASPANE